MKERRANDYDEKARAFVDKYRIMDEATKAMIETLKDIPVDICPVFNPSYGRWPEGAGTRAGAGP